MKNFFQRNTLSAAVFITGASVLIIEIVATRILAPYYGNTIFTVSSVITVILAALSVGYYAGGTLADRHPSYRWFFGIILLSGLGILLFHFVGAIALPLLSLRFSLATGPLVSSAFLFFLPALLLGMLSPYAIKLQIVYHAEAGLRRAEAGFGPAEAGIGNIAGKIFFWSTFGSILGSLLAGFVLIPNFGINQIVVANGIVLFALGFLSLLALGTAKKYLNRLLFSFVIIAVAAGLVRTEPVEGDIVYRREGIYQRITIYDGEYAGRPARFFQQDRNSSGAMFLDSEDPRDLAYEYSKYYALYKIFTPNVRDAVIIGGGASSMLKAILVELPDASFDVVEIEPSLFELARKYFRVPDSPRIRTYAEDGRRFLRDTEKSYDMIFSDVASSLFSIPAHFATQEFFELAKSKLNEGGLFIVNMIGDLAREQPSLILSEIRTFQSIFPNSYFFGVESPEEIKPQNIILVGHKSNTKIDVAALLSRGHPDPALRSFGDKLIDTGRLELSRYPVLTDNFSPTEYFAAKALTHFAGFERAFRFAPKKE